jgi:hypothetical protein
MMGSGSGVAGLPTRVLTALLGPPSTGVPVRISLCYRHIGSTQGPVSTALALQWRDIREQTILVERAVSLGEEKDTKTAAHRTVRLLPPRAADLREWRLRSGRPGDKALIFPSATGTVWSQPAYQSWRRRAFKRALDGADLEHAPHTTSAIRSPRSSSTRADR